MNLIKILFSFYLFQITLSINSLSYFYDFFSSKITNLTCELTPNKTKECIKKIDGNISITNCDRENNEICYVPFDYNDTENFYCGELKKFNGELCVVDNECLSGQCIWGYCDGLKNGGFCNYSYECGMYSYCSEGICVEYLLSEGNNCSIGKCAPQFYCSNKTYTCRKKAVLEDGQIPDDDEKQCKSFKIGAEGNCTSEYENDTDIDFIKKSYAEIYKNLDLTNKQYFIYDGINVGNLTLLNYFWKKELEEFDVEKSKLDCLMKPIKENFIMDPNSNFGLEPKDIRAFLNIVKKKYEEKWYIKIYNWMLQNQKYALLIITGAGLFFIILILIIICLCCCKKKNEFEELIQQQPENPENELLN